MSDIQRYEVLTIQDVGDLVENNHGSICLYDDHLAEIQDIYEPRLIANRERIAELEQELKTKLKCVKCDGTGRFQFRYDNDSWDDCPACNGKGQ